MHGFDQVVQAPAAPVEFPIDKGVLVSKGLQARRQPGAIVFLPRRVILIQLLFVDPDLD